MNKRYQYHYGLQRKLVFKFYLVIIINFEYVFFQLNVLVAQANHKKIFFISHNIHLDFFKLIQSDWFFCLSYLKKEKIKWFVWCFRWRIIITCWFELLFSSWLCHGPKVKGQELWPLYRFLGLSLNLHIDRYNIY